MLMLAALLASADTQAKLDVPLTIGPMLTRPLEKFQCLLHDRMGNAHPFEFEVTGGQAIFIGEKLAGYTPRIIKVLNDPKSIVADFPDQYQTAGGINRGEGQHAFGWAGKDSFKVGLYLDSENLNNFGPPTVAIYETSFNFAVVGICDHSSVDQPSIIKNEDEK